MNRQSRFYAGYRMLGAGALRWPRWMVRVQGWEHLYTHGGFMLMYCKTNTVLLIGYTPIESYDQPRQHIRKQRRYFANKGPSSQSYGFSSSHVWMWELDYKEIWALKNWWFWTVVLEKTLKSPLEIQPVHPKGNQSWICIGRTDAEAETAILWPPDVKNWLIWKAPEARKDWRQ